MRRGPGGLMLKALALTRKGSLGDATAVIQKALRLVVSDSDPSPRAARGVVQAPAAAGAPPPVLAGPAGAARTPTEHGFLEGRHSFAGATRNYKLFVPARLAEAPWLVVMLHGCTQGPDDFALGTRMNEWASREGFLVLYPEQSRSANPSSCWNWFQSNDQQRDHGEVGLIASLTRAVIAEHDVDPTRVYVAGLSAGGAMAANLAVAYPDLFAAVAIHSGLVAGAANNVVDALTAMRRGATRRGGAQAAASATPTIVFHGDDDRTVHPLNGDQIVAAAIGADATTAAETETGTSPGGQTYVKQSFRDRDGVTRVEQWKLKAAGHAWAGGDAAGTYTDPQGVDATREMLRFFATHSLEAVPAG